MPIRLTLGIEKAEVLADALRQIEVICETLPVVDVPAGETVEAGP